MACKHGVQDNCKKDGRPCIFDKTCFEPEIRKPMTNAERVRAMTDEELAEVLYHGVDDMYCCNDPACVAMLNSVDGIPEERCKACLLKWLQQPTEGDAGGG